MQILDPSQDSTLPPFAIAPLFKGFKRPLSGYRVPAGFPSPAEGYKEADLSIDQLLDLDKVSVFLYRVQGFSLNSIGILDGNIVTVNRALNPRNGQAILALIDGELTLKVYNKDAIGQIILSPASTFNHYKDIAIKDGMTLEVIGVVTGTIRKF